MIRFALDAITAFSVKPLALASYVGIASGLFALVIAGLFAGLVGRPLRRPVWRRGWTSLMSVMALLGSVQLIVLGIIGEYLGRMYEQVKGRPLFVIQEIARREAFTEPGEEFRRDPAESVPRPKGAGKAATPTV